MTVDADGLAGLPEALARRVALVALETANPGRSYGLEEADHIRAACGHPEKRSAANLSGVDVERLGANVVLVKRGSTQDGSRDPSLHPSSISGSPSREQSRSPVAAGL